MTETTENQITPKQLRQKEVDSYEANIALYQTLLANLDGDWDEDLLPLKNLDAHEAARQCPIDRIARLAVLQQHDQFTKLLKTETIECLKAKSILSIL